MDQKTAKSISHATLEIHDDITEIYENLMEEDNKEAITNIDNVVAKLKHLKANVTIKDKI